MSYDRKDSIDTVSTVSDMIEDIKRKKKNILQKFKKSIKKRKILNNYIRKQQITYFKQ